MEREKDAAEGCVFCRELALKKELFKRGWTSEERKLFYQKYQVCLVSKTYKRGCGRRGIVTHGARPLNFCPECGRALKRKWA